MSTFGVQITLPEVLARKKLDSAPGVEFRRGGASAGCRRPLRVVPLWLWTVLGDAIAKTQKKSPCSIVHRPPLAPSKTFNLKYSQSGWLCVLHGDVAMDFGLRPNYFLLQARTTSRYSALPHGSTARTTVVVPRYHQALLTVLQAVRGLIKWRPAGFEPPQTS